MKGFVFHGSLEDAIKNKTKFIENSTAFAKKKQSELIKDKYLYHSTNSEQDNYVKEERTEDVGKESIQGIGVETKVKMYSCEECSFEDKNPKRLQKHIRSEHVRNEKVHSCEECAFEDTNLKGLKIHIKIEHGQKEKPYKKCKFCLEEFQMREDQEMNPRYRNHLEKLHEKQDLSEFEKEFNKMDFLKCSVCEKNVYGSKPRAALSNLNRHIRDTHGNDGKEKKLVACPQCDKSLKANYVKMHIQITHNSAKYTCDQCGKSFKNQHQMRLHEKIHSNDKADSFKCEVCDELIPPYSSLRRHMYRKHGGRKFNPVTCDECGKQLSDKSKLDKHKDSIHLNKKPYQCQICKLSVSRIDNLKQHKLRVHKIEYCSVL